MENPCLKCDKTGCGAYHDICDPYQEYRKFRTAEGEAIRIHNANLFGYRENLRYTKSNMEEQARRKRR